MQNPRDLLVLLFGLFWASSLAAAARYRGFPTASIWNSWRYKAPEEQAGFWCRVRRLIVSTIVLNILPVVLLWALWEWVVIPTATFSQDGAWWRRCFVWANAVFAALSSFAMIRF